jgi:two-component system phosphate regulon response regulator PhoB
MQNLTTEIRTARRSVVFYSQDAQFYLMFAHILQAEGLATLLVTSIEDTLAAAAQKPVGAIVLDCRIETQLASQAARLKQDPLTRELPCIALVSPGAETQHIALLKSGVDEYLATPFAPAKLVDFLRSSLGLHRRASGRSANAGSFRYGDVELDLETHRALCGGKEISVGPIEFRLLRHLLEHPERVIGRDEFIAAAWPDTSHVSARTVDVHISQLRKLLKRHSRKTAIRTVRLAGYSLHQKTR